MSLKKKTKKVKISITLPKRNVDSSTVFAYPKICNKEKGTIKNV